VILKPEKKPSTADLKVKDVVNEILLGEAGENLADAQAYVKFTRGLSISHPDIDKALQEKFGGSKEQDWQHLWDLQGEQPIRLGKPEPKTSGIFRTHPVTGELFEYDPKDDSFHKVKR